jgi:hypothetical protein
LAGVTVQRFLAPSDLSVAEGWRLVKWCRDLGADEFTIDFLAADAIAVPEVWHSFDRMVHPFALGKPVRERMSGATADDLTRSTRVWTLNDTTIEALQIVLADGLFAFSPTEGGWFEDPVFYREGRLLLGVLSHEAFAVLRLSENESGQLSAAGFLSHESLPRAH